MNNSRPAEFHLCNMLFNQSAEPRRECSSRSSKRLWHHRLRRALGTAKSNARVVMELVVPQKKWQQQSELYDLLGIADFYLSIPFACRISLKNGNAAVGQVIMLCPVPHVFWFSVSTARSAQPHPTFGDMTSGASWIPHSVDFRLPLSSDYSTWLEKHHLKWVSKSLPMESAHQCVQTQKMRLGMAWNPSILFSFKSELPIIAKICT